MFAERTNWDLAANRLSQALARHREEGKPIFDLTVSNPTECGFRYAAEKILGSLGNPGTMHYLPEPLGLPRAREAVAGYYSGRRVHTRAEEILLTTSTSEAYSFIFRLLCNSGDELLIPAPSYPLFEFLAEIEDVELVRYPLICDQRWQIDFHSLERAATPRTRGVIVVHPNNPTGNFCAPEEMQRLEEFCAGREMALIADEVFLDYAVDGQTRRSFAEMGAALTFTLSGLSKICGLPQMKAAWIVVNGPKREKIDALQRLEVIADTFLSMNTPVQLAVPTFLQTRLDLQKQVTERVRKNLTELDHQLNMQTTCSRLVVEGGWNVVLRVPVTRSDEDLALEILSARDVSIHPGHFYDFSGEGYLVASLITPENAFAEGIRRVMSLF